MTSVLANLHVAKGRMAAGPPTGKKMKFHGKAVYIIGQHFS